jgi:FkbM family methyltransferase
MMYKGFEYPDGEKFTAECIAVEWGRKQQHVFNLTGGKGTAIQAGANCGFFPTKLAADYDNVLTFEPMPELAAIARRNLERHNVDNVKLYEMGLGSEAGTASVTFVDSKNCGATGLTEGEGEIELIAIDNFFLDDVSLIWLDIEGMEADALRGAINTIKRCRPILVLENKGLIPGFDDLEFRPLGDQVFRQWVESEFGYQRVDRIMRDDIFVPGYY